MLVIDLFSGLGGFSEAFFQRGHEVMRIEIDQKFKDVPNTIIADVRNLPFRANLRPDVLLMSPPCIEFCKESMPWTRTGNHPDMTLFEACLEAVKYFNPMWWILENVRGAAKYFKPYLGKYQKRCGPYYLWGRFPIFWTEVKKRKMSFPGQKPELRSKIPFDLSFNLCYAIETYSINYAK
ncbi:TPA_asm: DNA methyltransferase [Caudoviricetes sp. vir520]|nr:TPA_asm: DNA methyltransferase [Caudoviricetes sp. vir520]